MSKCKNYRLPCQLMTYEKSSNVKVAMSMPTHPCKQSCMRMAYALHMLFAAVLQMIKQPSDKEKSYTC